MKLDTIRPKKGMVEKEEKDSVLLNALNAPIATPAYIAKVLDVKRDNIKNFNLASLLNFLLLKAKKAASRILCVI